MRLAKGVESIGGLPMAHIAGLSAVVCSDLHLGYESVMAKSGTFMPKNNLNSIKKAFDEAASIARFDRVIITGDVKNDFGSLDDDELNELRELAAHLRNEIGVKDILLVKGNHDNYIDRMSGPAGIRVMADGFVEGGYLFAHGDSAWSESEDFSCAIIGHVHPSIGIYSSFGVKEKLRCFLSGRTRNGREVLVLPSMNFFSSGSDINMESKPEEMSPVFGDAVDVDSMHAICLGEGEVLDFGTIGELRKLAER